MTWRSFGVCRLFNDCMERNQDVFIQAVRTVPDSGTWKQNMHKAK